MRDVDDGEDEEDVEDVEVVGAREASKEGRRQFVVG